MSAMKNLFEKKQEEQYRKLEALGVSRENIYAFEKKLFYGNCSLEEFSGKMENYAETINGLAEETGYSTEYLWEIWQEIIEDECEATDENWNNFVAVTREKDW